MICVIHYNTCPDCRCNTILYTYNALAGVIQKNTLSEDRAFLIDLDWITIADDKEPLPLIQSDQNNVHTRCNRYPVARKVLGI